MLKTNIKFNYDHIKELYDTNKIDEAKTYFKQFFIEMVHKYFVLMELNFIYVIKKKLLN